MALDRDMLATDLAELLSREDYQIDVDSDDVKRGLDAFLEAIKPTTPAEAAARVGAFLKAHEEYRGHRTDEFREQIARIDSEVLNAGDLRVLIAAATGPRRSIREKLAERSHVATAEGVTPIKCPTCQGPAHLFSGSVQVHLTPGGLPCTGAGQAFQPPTSERRVDCPFCTATPTVNHGVISVHNSPETDRVCRGAGAAVPGE